MNRVRKRRRPSGGRARISLRDMLGAGVGGCHPILAPSPTVAALSTSHRVRGGGRYPMVRVRGGSRGNGPELGDWRECEGWRGFATGRLLAGGSACPTQIVGATGRLRTRLRRRPEGRRRAEALAPRGPGI
jgi:hypothetical protein